MAKVGVSHQSHGKTLPVCTGTFHNVDDTTVQMQSVQQTRSAAGCQNYLRSVSG